MSDNKRYRLVEDHRLDTWCFIAFIVIMGLISFSS
jgi:hypothetical protein